MPVALLSQNTNPNANCHSEEYQPNIFNAHRKWVLVPKESLELKCPRKVSAHVKRTARSKVQCSPRPVDTLFGCTKESETEHYRFPQTATSPFRSVQNIYWHAYKVILATGLKQKRQTALRVHSLRPLRCHFKKPECEYECCCVLKNSVAIKD
ncbi:hypothetical protein BaRGS_00007547 [Batillaria attramentaria]|uniref:Uncharacterized protein n=1 Tax=Batillaria attramentaria TaxID=370345 RepID=A0ABD0LN86_9CAEN